jgi:parvulin-like peptidyl-prolyl isomerase
MTLVKKLLREPLVHFLCLGALLFVYFEWKGGGAGPGSTHISITPGLVDEYVKEEIATREATAMGLDRDDTIIRRRLRQKMEFLVEDAVDQVPPTDAELEAWMERHPEAFRAEPRVALRQVYVSTERHGTAARADAERLLARLRAAGAGARTDALGDPSMLPAELPLGPLSEVTRAFGTDFAGKVDALAPGQWQGPLESPYGLHLVLVVQRVAAARPSLAEVRPLVEREFTAERRRAQLEALYERLLKKYTVAIEMPKEPEKKQAAAAGGSGR